MKMIYSSIILSVALTFFFPEKLKDIFLIIKKTFKKITTLRYRLVPAVFQFNSLLKLVESSV